MFFDYIKLAVNSLFKRKLRSWLTMIGIFIGIAAVVSLIGLGEGLRNAITSQFGALGADMITVQAGGTQYGPPGSGVVIPLELGIEDDIEGVEGVKFAIPRLLKSSTLEFNNQLYIGMAGSMPDGVYRKEIENIIGLKPLKGRLLKDGDRNKIVLGNKFKDDEIFGKVLEPGSKVLVKGKQFEVIGILKKSGNFLLDGATMINEAPLRALFDNTEEISILVVKAKNGADMNNLKADIEKLLRKERNVKKGEEDFSVELAINTVKTINSTLFAVQMFVYIIASISLLVGGIGIMNTMYTAVVERTKEIGIMKSIGARNINIFTIFLAESGLLGMTGGIIGVTVGVILAKSMAAAGAAQLGSDLIHAQISPWLVVGALLFSFIIGCIAGITPALRASRLHPVDALRYAK